MQQRLNLTSQNAGAGFGLQPVMHCTAPKIPAASEPGSVDLCMKGGLHCHCTQSIVFLLWSELPKNLLSLPFPELPAISKGMDKLLNDVFLHVF